MRANKKHLISLIMPAYKQEKTIEKDLLRIKNAMDQLRHDYEIIVVVDGLIDETLRNVRKIRSKKIIARGYKHNHGKGHALRYGMARAKGDVIGFIDAGMDLNPNGLSMLLEHFEWYSADIIIGSKWHPVSKVNYPLFRKIISLGYSYLVKILFGLRIKDTQLGMKFFKREVLEVVLPRLLVKKYAIDVEILAVADRLGYKRIYEAPIELDWKDVSSIVSKNLQTSIWNMFLDTLAIFYRLKILKYYDSSSKRKWKYNPELNFRVNLP